MAIAFVKEIGNRKGQPSASSWVITVSSAPAAGHLLILSIANGNFVLTGVTDTAGNTWTIDKKQLSGVDCCVCSTGMDGGIPTTITVTWAGVVSGRAAVAVHEFSGADVSSTRVDTTSGATTTASTARAAGTVATANANDLIWAGFSVNGVETSLTNDGSFISPSPAFYANTSAVSVEFEYRIVSSTASYTPAPTGGVSANSAGATVAYKASTTVKTLSAVGAIASAEAFGPATHVRSPQYIYAAGGIRSLQAFGSGDTYGPAFYGTSKYGGGSAASLAASPTTRQLVYPTAITTAQAFGTPVLRVMGTLTTVRPTAIGSAEAFGIPLLGLVDRTSSSYGGISLGDVEVFASASDDTTIYSGTGDDALLVATAIDDLPFGGGERISDQPQFVCTVDDIPGR